MLHGFHHSWKNCKYFATVFSKTINAGDYINYVPRKINSVRSKLKEKLLRYKITRLCRRMYNKKYRNVCFLWSKMFVLLGEADSLEKEKSVNIYT